MRARLSAGVMALGLFGFLWFTQPPQAVPALVSLVIAIGAGAAAVAEAMHAPEEGHE